MQSNNYTSLTHLHHAMESQGAEDMPVCPTRWTPPSNVLDDLVQRVGHHRTSRQTNCDAFMLPLESRHRNEFPACIHSHAIYVHAANV